MSDYAALMREINECLAHLVDKTEASEPKAEAKEDNVWLAADVALSAELETDCARAGGEHAMKKQPHLLRAPLKTDTRSETSKSVVTEKKGVRWARVKISGMPGYFVRRLPVLKTAVCGICNEPVVGKSHQECITQTSKAVWNSSVKLTPSHHRIRYHE